MSDRVLRLYTIYEKPLDAPGAFVVRRFLIEAGHVSPDVAYVAPDLDAARRLLPVDVVRLPRAPDDDPVIVESWV
jgi:hypothetical protein